MQKTIRNACVQQKIIHNYLAKDIINVKGFFGKFWAVLLPL